MSPVQIKARRYFYVQMAGTSDTRFRIRVESDLGVGTKVFGWSDFVKYREDRPHDLLRATSVGVYHDYEVVVPSGTSWVLMVTNSQYESAGIRYEVLTV